MRWKTVGSLAIGLSLMIGCVSIETLEAQTLPLAAHVIWSPNAATEAVTSYRVTLDGGTPVVVPASACTPTDCSVAVTITTLGPHTASVVAIADWAESAPATVTVNVSQPNAPKGVKLTK